MVVGIVASLASLVKARVSNTKVDSTIFRLHYRWTTTFCFLSCALIAASDVIGKPIECEDASAAVSTFCWVSSTFTINTTFKENDFNYYGAHGSKFSGLGNFNPKIHEKRFHAYYQFVPFVLFLQGCLFYLPHQIWKTIEGKRLDNLLQGLNVFSITEDTTSKKKNIVRYLRNSRGLNQKYSFGYIICEFLNLVNVAGQMFLLDSFFGGMFLHYGTKQLFLLSVSGDEGRYDPMVETFPRITKCSFFKFGPTGTIQNLDYLCLLPQNILNEKIFLIMWFWFVILSIITLMQMIFRILMSVFPVIRIKLLDVRCNLENSFDIEELVRKMSLGDFFLLYSISKNVDGLCFTDILKDVVEKEKVDNNRGNGLVAPVYNHSFVNDLDGTIDLRYRKKMEENAV